MTDYFDSDEKLAGSFEDGSFYNNKMSQIGRFDEFGNIFDASGKLVARFDEYWNVLSPETGIIGKISDGVFFGKDGDILARLDLGNLFDKEGKLLYRFDSCDENDMKKTSAVVVYRLLQV